MPIAATEEEWLDLYRRRFPRTRANGLRAVRALYTLLREQPAEGFTVRDVAARAQVGLDTVARAVRHLARLGVITVAGGGWVAEPGGRPGRGLRHTYVAHWPPGDGRPGALGRPRPTPRPASPAVAAGMDGGIVAGGGIRSTR